MLAGAEEIRKVGKDLRVLGKFVETFCRRHCGEVERAAFRIKTVDLTPTGLGRRKLCGECARVLRHAVTKRLACPLEPKPACRHCPVHCYAPAMRERIREVMKFSGRHLILRGRLDFFLHFLKRRPKEFFTKDGRRVEERP